MNPLLRETPVFFDDLLKESKSLDKQDRYERQESSSTVKKSGVKVDKEDLGTVVEKFRRIIRRLNNDFMLK